MAGPAPGISSRMLATIQAVTPIAAGIGSGVVKPGDINLADGENTFMKEAMVDICRDAISKNLTADAFANPKVTGDPTLRGAFANYFNTYFHPSIPLTPDHIVPTAGSGGCIDATIFTICDTGDTILSPGPSWWGYAPFARIHAEVNVIQAPINIKDGLTMAIIPALETAYASVPDPERVKAVITSNPNNPFLQAFPPEVVKGMLDFCHRRGLHYISDEVFASTVFDPQGNKFVSALALVKGEKVTERGDGEEKSEIDPGAVHVVYSATKDFGSCGIRAGCIVSHHPLVRAGVNFATVWQTSSLSAILMTAFLNSPELPTLLSTSRSRLAACYKIVVDTLIELDIEVSPATAGLWLNAKVKDAETADVIKKWRDNGVIVGRGTEFNSVEGEKGWIKITFALPEEIVKEGMERFKVALRLASKG